MASNDELPVPLKVFQVVNKPCQTNGNLDSHFPEVTRDEHGNPVKGWKELFAKDIASAKSLCGNCDSDTRGKCLSFALDNKIPYGIWGGTTPDERRLLKRRQDRKKVEV